MSLTTTFGIIGYPISHSISPVFQQAAFDFVGSSDTYKSYEVHPDQLRSFMELVKDSNMKGFNVTVPHKSAVMEYLDEIDDWALKAGAVNTVVRTGNMLKGYNTDGYGFMTGLYSNTDIKITESNVLILGAGGSARAVLLSLMDAEAKSICIANRTLDNAELLQRRFDERSSNTHVIAISDPKFLSYVQNADVIVNCTTIGMKNTDGILPFTDSDIHSETILYDLVYNPLRTLMLREGEKANCTVISGIDMLVYQGAKAFQLWFGREAPVQVMFNAAKSMIL